MRACHIHTSYCLPACRPSLSACAMRARASSRPMCGRGRASSTTPRQVQARAMPAAAEHGRAQVPPQISHTSLSRSPRRHMRMHASVAREGHMAPHALCSAGGARDGSEGADQAALHHGHGPASGGHALVSGRAARVHVHACTCMHFTGAGPSALLCAKFRTP